MPLFQPSNITPSSFAGVGGGTVAVADNVKITWQLNGNVAMTAYKIDIFNMNNNLSYSSGVITLSVPKYPTDNKGNPTYFEHKLKNKNWENLGLSDGNEYTLQITQYWGGLTDSDHSVTQFSQSAFITRTTPTLNITTASGNTDFSTIGSVFQGFKANYTQEQGDSIDWVRWKFYQGNTLLDDTGIVNTQVLKYTAESMQSGKLYKIVCTIQTENGVQATSEREFSVLYELPEIEGEFQFNCLDKASNLLSWDEIQSSTGNTIQGENSGNSYTFEDGELVLQENSSIFWTKKNEESLDIPTDWTFAWKGKAELKYSIDKDTSSDITTYGYSVSLYNNCFAIGAIDGCYYGLIVDNKFVYQTYISNQTICIVFRYREFMTTEIVLN